MASGVVSHSIAPAAGMPSGGPDPTDQAWKRAQRTRDLPGCTDSEKLKIARRYLIPRQLKENELTPDTPEHKSGRRATVLPEAPKM
jgi:hypothetical protein